jgi:hypothetical protein
MKFVSQKDWGMPPYALRSLSNRKVQFLHGFTGGGKFMDLFTRSSLRKSKKPYGISLPLKNYPNKKNSCQ